MLTPHHQKHAFDVGKHAPLDVEHASPLYARGCVIDVFTRYRASLASDAAVDVHHHAVTRDIRMSGHHQLAVLRAPSPRKIFTRARSAPLPVESVNESDRDVTEFKLGSSRSLANGVAQWSN